MTARRTEPIKTVARKRRRRPCRSLELGGGERRPDISQISVPRLAYGRGHGRLRRSPRPPLRSQLTSDCQATGSKLTDCTPIGSEVSRPVRAKRRILAGGSPRPSHPLVIATTISAGAGSDTASGSVRQRRGGTYGEVTTCCEAGPAPASGGHRRAGPWYWFWCSLTALSPSTRNRWDGRAHALLHTQKLRQDFRAHLVVRYRWTTPSQPGAAFSLAVIRKQATDPAYRIGSLINPGSPGVEFVKQGLSRPA